MKFNDWTKRVMAYRKMRRDLLAKGWEEVGECGGALWELYRGSRTHARIVDVRIAPDGKSLFVNIEPKQRPPYLWEVAKTAEGENRSADS